MRSPGSSPSASAISRSSTRGSSDTCRGKSWRPWCTGWIICGRPSTSYSTGGTTCSIRAWSSQSPKSLRLQQPVLRDPDTPALVPLADRRAGRPRGHRRHASPWNRKQPTSTLCTPLTRPTWVSCARSPLARGARFLAVFQPELREQSSPIASRDQEPGELELSSQVSRPEVPGEVRTNDPARPRTSARGRRFHSSILSGSQSCETQRKRCSTILLT